MGNLQMKELNCLTVLKTLLEIQNLDIRVVKFSKIIIENI